MKVLLMFLWGTIVGTAAFGQGQADDLKELNERLTEGSALVYLQVEDYGADLMKVAGVLSDQNRPIFKLLDNKLYVLKTKQPLPTFGIANWYAYFTVQRPKYAQATLGDWVPYTTNPNETLLVLERIRKDVAPKAQAIAGKPSGQDAIQQSYSVDALSAVADIVHFAQKPITILVQNSGLLAQAPAEARADFQSGVLRQISQRVANIQSSQFDPRSEARLVVVSRDPVDVSLYTAVLPIRLHGMNRAFVDQIFVDLDGQQFKIDTRPESNNRMTPVDLEILKDSLVGKPLDQIKDVIRQAVRTSPSQEAGSLPWIGRYEAEKISAILGSFKSFPMGVSEVKPRQIDLVGFEKQTQQILNWKEALVFIKIQKSLEAEMRALNELQLRAESSADNGRSLEAESLRVLTRFLMLAGDFFSETERAQILVDFKRQSSVRDRLREFIDRVAKPLENKVKSFQKVQDPTFLKNTLLSGVQGMGKTTLVESLAKQADLPAYKFDLGDMLAKYSGEGEANLRKAFETVEALNKAGVPHIIFLDELHNILGGSPDSNTQLTSMIGKLKQEMTKNYPYTFFIAASNGIERINDPAILDRFYTHEHLYFPGRNNIKRLVTSFLIDRSTVLRVVEGSPKSWTPEQWERVFDVLVGRSNREIVATLTQLSSDLAQQAVSGEASMMKWLRNAQISISVQDIVDRFQQTAPKFRAGSGERLNAEVLRSGNILDPEGPQLIRDKFLEGKLTLADLGKLGFPNETIQEWSVERQQLEAKRLEARRLTEDFTFKAEAKDLLLQRLPSNGADLAGIMANENAQSLIKQVTDRGLQMTFEPMSQEDLVFGKGRLASARRSGNTIVITYPVDKTGKPTQVPVLVWYHELVHAVDLAAMSQADHDKLADGIRRQDPESIRQQLQLELQAELRSAELVGIDNLSLMEQLYLQERIDQLEAALASPNLETSMGVVAKVRRSAEAKAWEQIRKLPGVQSIEFAKQRWDAKLLEMSLSDSNAQKRAAAGLALVGHGLKTGAKIEAVDMGFAIAGGYADSRAAMGVSVGLSFPTMGILANALDGSQMLMVSKGAHNQTLLGFQELNGALTWVPLDPKSSLDLYNSGWDGRTKVVLARFASGALQMSILTMVVSAEQWLVANVVSQVAARALVPVTVAAVNTGLRAAVSAGLTTTTARVSANAARIGGVAGNAAGSIVGGAFSASAAFNATNIHTNLYLDGMRAQIASMGTQLTRGPDGRFRVVQNRSGVFNGREIDATELYTELGSQMTQGCIFTVAGSIFRSADKLRECVFGVVGGGAGFLTSLAIQTQALDTLSKELENASAELSPLVDAVSPNQYFSEVLRMALIKMVNGMLVGQKAEEIANGVGQYIDAQLVFGDPLTRIYWRGLGVDASQINALVDGLEAKVKDIQARQPNVDLAEYRKRLADFYLSERYLERKLTRAETALKGCYPSESCDKSFAATVLRFKGKSSQDTQDPYTKEWLGTDGRLGAGMKLMEDLFGPSASVEDYGQRYALVETVYAIALARHFSP